MDSRYLFRGKRLDDGEWIYGSYIEREDLSGKDQTNPIIFNDKKHADGWYSHEVNPATIGQCTGLHAAKSYRGESEADRLIFEGDACEFEYCNNRYNGKIVFNQKTCAFEMWNEIVVGAYGEKATNTRLLCHCDNIKIIGTIHDRTEGKEV